MDIQIKSELEKLRGISKEQSQTLSELEHIRTKTIKEINDYRDALKASIDRHHDEEINKLENKMSALKTAMKIKQELITQKIESIESHLTSNVDDDKNLNDIDFTTTLPTVTVTPPIAWDKTTGAKINYTENQLKMKAIEKKPVVKSKSTNIDSSHSTTPVDHNSEAKTGHQLKGAVHKSQTLPAELSTSTADKSYSQIFRQFVHTVDTKTALTTILNEKLQFSKIKQSTALQFKPTRLKLIGNELFCTGTISSGNYMEIFSLDCEPKKQVKLKSTIKPSVVISDMDKNLVATGPQNNGIDVLGNDGHYKYALPGDADPIRNVISDVVLYNQHLYALDSTEGLVHIFKQKVFGRFSRSTKWVLDDSIVPLDQCGKQEKLNSLGLYKGNVCVGSADGVVYTVNEVGEVVHEHTGLTNPTICNTDCVGNIMVLSGSRLQVCTIEGQSHIISVTDPPPDIVDAVLDETGNNIWMINDENKVFKYTASVDTKL